MAAAIEQDGGPRDGAWVAELPTGQPRRLARRHPADLPARAPAPAQLSFTDLDGHASSASSPTNRQDIAALEVLHRQHAQVEDRSRRSSSGRELPAVPRLHRQRRVARACPRPHDVMVWTSRSPRRRHQICEPKRLRYRICTSPAAHRRARQLTSAPPGRLALDRRDPQGVPTPPSTHRRRLNASRIARTDGRRARSLTAASNRTPRHRPTPSRRRSEQTSCANNAATSPPNPVPHPTTPQPMVNDESRLAARCVTDCLRLVGVAVGRVDHGLGQRQSTTD